MLTQLIARFDAVSESSAEYNAADEYEYRDAGYEYRDAEYEYRDAEYENKHEAAESELSRSPEPGLRLFSNGQSNFPARCRVTLDQGSARAAFKPVRREPHPPLAHRFGGSLTLANLPSTQSCRLDLRCFPAWRLLDGGVPGRPGPA